MGEYCVALQINICFNCFDEDGAKILMLGIDDKKHIILKKIDFRPLIDSI